MVNVNNCNGATDSNIIKSAIRMPTVRYIATFNNLK